MLTCHMKSYWVYILASRPRGTLYVGMTNDLIRRAFEHREGLAEGFSRHYGVKMLVYYEQHATALAAIQREKEHQTLVASLEDRPHSDAKSGLARLVGRHCSLTCPPGLAESQHGPPGQARQ